jgi:outer membrane protein assembly factor BamB
MGRFLTDPSAQALVCAMNRSLAMVFAALTATTLAETPHWSGFRGNNGAGFSPTAKPPARFGPEDNVVWKIEVPWAPSSPTVWGDRIFLSTFASGKLETRAYSRKDGKLLWSRQAPAEKLEEFHQTEGSPAAATPVTDGRRVVSYFGSAGLFCYDFDGNELWKRPLPLATTLANFGSGTSPVLMGDKVILNRDMANTGSLHAFSLADGKELWSTPRPGATTSYSSPVRWQSEGRDEVIIAGTFTLRAYDLATGVERWFVRGLPSYPCTSPVVGDGMLFFAGWSPGKSDSPWPSWASTAEREDKNHDGKISVEEFANGPVWFKAQDVDGDGFITEKDWEAIRSQMARGENQLLAIKPGGTGDVTDTHVAWRFGKGLPYVPCPLHYDGRVYLVKDGGMMSSFDAATGKSFYTQERLNALGSYYASPAAADGRIYLASLDGKVSVVKAGGEKPEILHQVDFKERIAGTPALVEDTLYLRTQSALYAFSQTGTR